MDLSNRNVSEMEDSRSLANSSNYHQESAMYSQGSSPTNSSNLVVRVRQQRSDMALSDYTDTSVIRNSQFDGDGASSNGTSVRIMQENDDATSQYTDTSIVKRYDNSSSGSYLRQNSQKSSKRSNLLYKSMMGSKDDSSSRRSKLSSKM